MSFGFTALAAVTLGVGLYSADKARKAQHEGMDAQRDADAADARQKAELETSTAVAANAKFAADKRARQYNVLALGGGASPLGGAPTGGQVVGGGTGAPLGAGMGAATAGAGANVLGSGSVGGRSGRPQAGGPGGIPRQGGPGTA